MNFLRLCKFLAALCLCLACINLSHAQSNTFRIALFAPRVDAFWPSLSNFMQAVCEDLTIECLTYFSNDNLYKMEEQIREASSGPYAVDAIIFHSYKNQGNKLIKIAEELNINAFLINAGLGEEYQNMGIPREYYQYWLGEMLPNDVQIGFDLANALIDAAIAANQIGNDGKVHMFGISGIISDAASILRTRGLQQAIETRDDVILHQVVPGDWQIEDARQKFLGLIERYPEVTAVWGASDAKALGALKGAEQLGLKPGQDIFVGGVNFSSSAISKVKDGRFSVDIGGHFMEAGWAVIMLYDYLNGIDFANEGLQFKSEMMIIKPDATEALLEYFVDRNWGRIDFSKFSKTLNQGLTKYDFSLSAIVDQVTD